MGWVSDCRADNYARPRLIRGTRTTPLPLLPSGPGGVCSRPLHAARDLTSNYRSKVGHALACPVFWSEGPRAIRTVKPSSAAPGLVAPSCNEFRSEDHTSELQSPMYL